MTTQYMEITNESEWLEKRKGYVTSTEVASLYGVQPAYSPTAFELWHIKHGNIIPPDISKDEFIVFGKMMESVIVEMIKLQNPTWIIEPCNVFAYDDEYGIGSSFDYWLTIDGRKGLLEIKSTSYKYYKQEFEADEAPVHYEIQAQTELEMMPEAEFIMIVPFIADTRSLEYIKRERDSEMGKAMRAAVKSFWDKKDAPAIDYSLDKSTLAKVAPKLDPERVMDATQNTRITELSSMYKAEKELEKQAGKNADAFYCELMELLGNAKYAWTNEHKITVSDVAENEGKLITQDDVGTRTGQRSGYKKLTITEVKKK